jgi:hypothetical protein
MTTASDGQGESQLLEALADLEHQQWMEWAKTLMEKEPISQARRDRWAGFMVPYSVLPESVKEHDRVWARKAIALLRELVAASDFDRVRRELDRVRAECSGLHSLVWAIARGLGCNARSEPNNNGHLIDRAKYLGDQFTGDRYVATERALAERDASRRELEEATHQSEWIRDEWNKLLHPDGDGPKRPAFCDLLAYTAGDIRKLTENRNSMTEKFLAANLLCEKFIAQRDEAIRQRDEAMGEIGQLKGNYIHDSLVEKVNK